MAGCKNSTESGCRCPEHHPGLTGTPPATLHIVTPGPRVTPARAQTDTETAVNTARAACPACSGNPDVCLAGDHNFNRLAGCAAYTHDGQIAPLRAKRAPAQPWHVRPSRRAA